MPSKRDCRSARPRPNKTNSYEAKKLRGEYVTCRNGRPVEREKAGELSLKQIVALQEWLAEHPPDTVAAVEDAADAAAAAAEQQRALIDQIMVEQLEAAAEHGEFWRQ